MGSNTSTSYFLYEKTFAVNPLILNRNYEEKGSISKKELEEWKKKEIDDVVIDPNKTKKYYEMREKLLQPR